MTLRRILPGCGLLILALSACGCGSTESIDAAKQAVVQFHARQASGETATIYQAADPEFQKALDLETWNKFCSRIQRKLGAPQRADNNGFHINYSTGGVFVTLSYNSKFEKGDATETFVWKVKDNQPALLNYEITSNLLLTD